MTFFILLAGLFILIHMKKPVMFSKTIYEPIFLLAYLTILTVYIINDTFYYMVPEKVLLFVTVIVMLPTFIRFVSYKKDGNKKVN